MEKQVWELNPESSEEELIATCKQFTNFAGQTSEQRDLQLRYILSLLSIKEQKRLLDEQKVSSGKILDEQKVSSGKMIRATWALVIVTLIVTSVGIVLQIKNSNDTNKVASASFVWNISTYLDSTKYSDISNTINNNPSNYRLFATSTKQKRVFSETSVDDYIGNFETVGDLMREGVVNPNMAYDELGYLAEKAWCNYDVQKYIDQSRKSDGITSGSKAFYYGFEELAKLSLSIDHKTCPGMDKE